MVKIFRAAPGSAAAKNGILPGDTLLSVNGSEINDILDYRFYICSKRIELVLSRGETQYTVTITKSEYGDIGLEFETYLMDKKKACKNKCVFCFIDQLPKSPRLRDTLYFKDDDERLSFLQGNYITLTNLGEKDIDRITEMRISPVNISVHTTNPELRVKLMGNNRAGDVLSYMHKLASAGISLNTQIVLCKNYNDGAELDRTLSDLSELAPAVNSIAVVPAGLTKYRSGLCPLEPFSAEDSRRIIAQTDMYGEKNLAENGKRLVYAADEIYLKAGIDIPQPEYYEGYPQIENGVGMIRDHIENFAFSLDELEGAEFDEPQKFTLVTGSAFYPVLKTEAADVMKRVKKLTLEVAEIENDFFGHEITVAGLVTGGDIIRKLAQKKDLLGSMIFIPSAMLRHEGDMFLDGVTKEELSLTLGAEVTATENFTAEIKKLLKKT